MKDEKTLDNGSLTEDTECCNETIRLKSSISFWVLTVVFLAIVVSLFATCLPEGFEVPYRITVSKVGGYLAILSLLQSFVSYIGIDPHIGTLLLSAGEGIMLLTFLIGMRAQRKPYTLLCALTTLFTAATPLWPLLPDSEVYGFPVTSVALACQVTALVFLFIFGCKMYRTYKSGNLNTLGAVMITYPLAMTPILIALAVARGLSNEITAYVLIVISGILNIVVTGFFYGILLIHLAPATMRTKFNSWLEENKEDATDAEAAPTPTPEETKS